MRIPGVRYVQGRNSYTDADGTKYGVAIHNTSNDASAAAEASYAQRRTDGISSHLYADGAEVIQSLDTDARAGHAGSAEGNGNAVAVEIRGVNGWTRQQWLDRVAWDKLGAALAQVVRKYGISVRRASVAEMKANPKVRAFYSHDDMRRAWGGTTHTDPGPNFPWDRLFQAVTAALNPVPPKEDDDMPTIIVFTHGGRRWRGDGVTRTLLAGAADEADLKHVAGKAGIKVVDWGTGAVANPNAFGAVVEPAQVDAKALGAVLAANEGFVGAIGAAAASRIPAPPAADQIAKAVLDEDHRRSAA